MVVCYNGTIAIEILAKHLFVQSEQDLIEFINKSGGIAQAITKIKIAQKSVELAKFDEYKLTILDEESGQSVTHVWPVVQRRHWIFCVQTPIGPLWIGNNHIYFSVENVNVNKSRLSEYLVWLQKWASREENLYVPLKAVDGLSSAHNKQTYQFEYVFNHWSSQFQTWEYAGKSVKEARIPREFISSVNSQPASPVWYMSRLINGGGREAFIPIYGVNLDDLYLLLAIQ